MNRFTEFTKMLVYRRIQRTKEDFLKKKGKSSVRTFKSYTQIFKNTDEQSAIKNLDYNTTRRTN